MSQLHVIFGAGQIGSALARHLLARDHRVRVVRRSNKPVGHGIEVIAADAMEPGAAIAAAEGADVVYHCMNASAYTGAVWQDELPRMAEALIAAARAADARLVCLDNLYGYGPVDGPRTESTPLRADDPKGRIRAQLAARYQQAGEREGLRWTAGRGGDFFGPGTGDQSVVSMDVARGLGHGRRALLLGHPEAPHAFSYAPDVVAALGALGEADDDVEGRAWHLPVHTLPPRELVDRLAAAPDQRARTIVLRPWMFPFLGLFVPILRSLRDTLYQWDRPFLVDDSAFRARFPGVGVTTERAVAEIVAELRAAQKGEVIAAAVS